MFYKHLSKLIIVAKEVAQWIKSWTFKHEVLSSVPCIAYAKVMPWFFLSLPFFYFLINIFFKKQTNYWYLEL